MDLMQLALIVFRFLLYWNKDLYTHWSSLDNTRDGHLLVMNKELLECTRSAWYMSAYTDNNLFFSNLGDLQISHISPVEIVLARLYCIVNEFRLQKLIVW